MRFEKIKLDDMKRCHAAGALSLNGRFYAVFASEAVDGPCYAYTGERFEEKEVIWEKAGGTVSLAEIPGRDGEFIAVQRFFPGFQSYGAKLVWGKRTHSGWEVNDLVNLPYVHRFDLFPVEGEIYLFAAILCGSKNDRDDWSDPGKIIAGKLPAKAEEGIAFNEICGSQTRNHGYCRSFWQGRAAGFWSSDSGVFAAVPPDNKDCQWQISKLLDRPVSDLALCDLDRCGEDELVTIEPFHGNQFVVNKKTQSGYEIVWRYPNEIDFAHTVTGCNLLGKPAVICGARRKNCELFVLQYESGKGFFTTLVEEGAGTSNAVAANVNGVDIIIAANHTKNEAAVYIARE